MCRPSAETLQWAPLILPFENWQPFQQLWVIPIHFSLHQCTQYSCITVQENGCITVQEDAMEIFVLCLTPIDFSWLPAVWWFYKQWDESVGQDCVTLLTFVNDSSHCNAALIVPDSMQAYSRARCGPYEPPSTNTGKLMRYWFSYIEWGKNKEMDVRCTDSELNPEGHEEFADMFKKMRAAKFCPAFPGDAASTRRLSEIFLAGCVPIFLGPPYHSMPFGDTVKPSVWPHLPILSTHQFDDCRYTLLLVSVQWMMSSSLPGSHSWHSVWCNSWTLWKILTDSKILKKPRLLTCIASQHVTWVAETFETGVLDQPLPCLSQAHCAEKESGVSDVESSPT